MAEDQRRKELLTRLTELARDSDCRVYAVMDGAFYGNIRQACRDAGLECRAHYRDNGNPAVVIGGPWIVNPYRDWIGAENYAPPAWTAEWESGSLTLEDLTERMNAAVAAGDPSGGGLMPFDDVRNAPATIARLDTILRIADGKPGLVFWVGDATLTDEILYRHLRRLNKILIPKGQDHTGEEQSGELSEAAADAEEIPVPSRSDACELVIFRHADASVMAQVVPALDAGQLSRLLGPCRQILCAPAEEWADEILVLDRLEDWPAPHSGPLRFSPGTVRAIEQARFNWLTGRTAAYLRQYAQDETAAMPEDELRAHVRDWLQSAAGYGVTEEAAFRKWSYMQLMTGGKLTTGKDLHRFMSAPDPALHPNTRVSLLMRGTIEYLKGR